ncbi:MAG TPA: hypothetical protein VFJ66_07865 [Gaiellales bacterium]|nr:hypothetical protein [Gaiellales bacterium]
MFNAPVKKILALTAAVGAAAALAIPALAATKTVKVSDHGFLPGSVSIHKGDSIKWVWVGKKKHQVFQTDGPGHFHYPPQPRVHAHFTHRFTKRGTYKFVDPYSTMYMTVKVR